MLHQAPWQRRLDNLVENHGQCHFGLPALLAPLIASVLPEAVAGASIFGVAVPEIAAGVGVGAAGGAALSGITGGNPLTGALTGGLTGGIGTFGPAIGSALGIGTTAGDILAGVGGGVLGAELTGGNPLTGALTGGAGGALSGVFSGGTTAAAPSTTSGSATPGPGPAPAATAVPTGAASAPAGAAAQGDIGAAAAGDTNLLAGPATTGTGASSNLLAGPATVGPATPATGTAAPSTGGAVSGGGGGGGAVSGPVVGAGGNYYAGGTLTNPAGSITPGGVSSAWNTMASTGTGTMGGSTTASTGISGIVDSLKGDIGKLFSNPLALGAAGLLAMNMFGSQNSSEQQTMDQLQAQAASAASTAKMLQAPLTSGVLPPGAQSTLDVAEANEKAAARSAYASMGMGDSTGQADAFQAIAENIAAQKFGIENMLFGEAGPYAQIASTDYNNILNQQRAQDTQFTGALTNFVAALAGSKAGQTTAA